MAATGHTLLLRQVLLGGYSPVAFVGSGLSRRGSWEAFLLALADRANHVRGRAYIERAIKEKTGSLDEMLALADECIPRIGEEHIPKFVHDFFTRPLTGSYLDPMIALVRAPFAYYVTTNYDTEIEDAYRDQHGVELDSATLEQPSKVGILLERGVPFVLKIHGCVKAGGPLVVGAKDYQDIVFGRPEARAILQLVLGCRPVVLLGYGHRDPHISAYLDHQRQSVRHVGLRLIAFIRRNEDLPFDLADYYKSRFGIDSIVLDDWSDLSSQFNQCAYLQARDKYTGVRVNKRARFERFLEDEKPTDAWDAILFAIASSDLGYTSELKLLHEATRRSPWKLKAIRKDKALELIYLMALGQMLKRTRRRSAERMFAKAVALADGCTNDEVVAPIRSAALRYAGIYWFVERGDRQQGHTLLKRANEVFGTTAEFPEERLDARKWLAIYNGRARGQRHKAAKELEKIVLEATSLGYRKNAAWARLNLAEMLTKSTLPQVKECERHLQDALDAFVATNHHRGEIEGRLRLAELVRTKAQLAPGTPWEKTVREHLVRALKLAAVLGDRRIVRRTHELRRTLLSREVQ